jgi:hypothetical protein
MPEKFTFEFIFEYFKSQNCELLSTEYINNRTKLNYIWDTKYKKWSNS